MEPSSKFKQLETEDSHSIVTGNGTNCSTQSSTYQTKELPTKVADCMAIAKAKSQKD